MIYREAHVLLEEIAEAVLDGKTLPHSDRSVSALRASPRPTAFYLVPRKRSTISGSIGSTASV